MKTHATFAELLQAYFTERLMHQRNASPNTVASHRDTFRLLLGFVQRVLRKTPDLLTVEDLTPPFLGRFLEYLEKDRGNSPRSRNVRLAAIHSFFGYVALQEPGLSALAQRVLAIPGKRYKTKPVDFLTQAEIDALLAAPDQTTWSGRRDRTLLLVAAQTGLRVSELVGLCFQTSCSAPGRMCAAPARDANNAPHPCARTPSPRCARGSENATASPQTRSFPVPVDIL